MATSSSSSASTGSSSGPEVMNLKFHDLETITNQFSDENKIGQGGYGEVYRGEYKGYEIAVKKLFVRNGHDDTVFANEFAQLMKVRHENIIRLIAYCRETRDKPIQFNGQNYLALVIDRALCFEYMPRGSLANHISDESCIHGWATTYKIIRGTCEGLHYLHKGRGEGDYIYHLDLKPDNILLDKDMTPKIADFGLSRLFGESKTYQTCSAWKGSLGFMPLEYINNCTISPKNDVFSLGVIIFYLVAGRIRYGDYCDSRPSCENFTEKVQEYWKKKVCAAVSSYTWEEIDLLGVKICIELAMRCVETDRAKRPSTEGIIDELQKLDVQIKKMSKKHFETLSGQAAQLLVMLRAQGDGERGGNQAWDQLRGKLVEVATYIANPRITLRALLDLLKDARNLHLGHPEAHALVRCIMAYLEEETVRAMDADMAIPRLRELLLVVADQLDMFPLCDSDPMHMVDANNNFCEENVADIVKCSPHLSAPNAPYAVVSIVGSQTSGKSYLLNRLFGTKFPVMNKMHGWSQTTKGIMMSRCIGPSLLVLDFQGFDGRERGQDTLFDRQAVLFALTISDVILVNMNVNDIGQEQAGGTLLFKRIFKERRKLETSLTKILVVLRMYEGETPLEILRDDMMRRLEEIWRSVNVTSLRFEDYIEVNVVALQAKRSESFQKEVTTLRRLLSRATAVRGLLFPNTTPNHNRSDKVPVSGFSVSLKPIWDTITKKVKLDYQAAQLLVTLRNQAWDQLRRKLVQVATYVANPRITVDALLDLLGDARNLRLGHPEVEALFWRIMAVDAGMDIPRLRELLLVVADELDMVPLCDSDPVHMVDGSNFCEENVADLVKCSAWLSAPNAPYAVVSIVGSQSSGKSYLLNRLFGTKFPVMDASRGWSRTTRGIMMSRCIGPSLLVLDVEGFCGRGNYHGEQDILFERQAVLLALTISDVLLVNMNVLDIGREQAGGTLLVNTIFKERTKLPAGLTNILVVVRMYDGETPFELLKDDVIKSLQKVWRSVTEESLKFEDYFEVNVVGLPDKNSIDFPKEVTIIRRLLSKSTINLKGSAKVPASSFSVSSRRFWDKIKKNEKLDIPSHQV